jgi:ribonuclease III
MTIQDLMQKLDLPIKDAKLIQNAFVHRSYLNENKEFTENNERLEYLGDAVLELATSHYLYSRFSKEQEGMLTNLRAALVRTTSLAEISKKLGLSDLLLMSKGEEAGGGRDNISLLADCFEAFLGAIYLDTGYTNCVKLLDNVLFPNIDSVVANLTYKDNKSELLDESGPDHSKVFVMQVKLGNRTFGTGQGKSKQLAQEAAAKNTLELITTNC